MSPVNFDAMLADPMRQIAIEAGLNPDRLDAQRKLLRAALSRTGGIGEAVHEILDALEKLCGSGFWGRASARLLRKVKDQEEQLERIMGRLTSIRGVMAARVSDAAALAAIERILAESA